MRSAVCKNPWRSAVPIHLGSPRPAGPLRVTANLPSGQTTRARDPKWAQSGRPARLRAARHLSSTTQAPQPPPASHNLRTSSHFATTRRTPHRQPPGPRARHRPPPSRATLFDVHPVLVNPRGRRPERAWVAVTTTALTTRDSPQHRPQRPLTGGHDKKGGQHDSRGHHRPWVENLTEQAQRVARPREHRVTCSWGEKEMSRDKVFDRSQPARANQGLCAHLPRLAEPWHGGRVGAVVCGEITMRRRRHQKLKIPVQGK